jgi:selenide,water dikinase
MKKTATKTRLLLVGAGLTHICLLNKLSRPEMERLKIILIAPYSSFYYSEMAAGYLEGTFTEHEIVVDILKLCNSKGVHFVEAAPVKLDLQEKSVALSDGRNITFDMLSLNLDQYGRYVEGVAQYGVPIDYHDNLKKVKRYFADHHINTSITIVGAGKLGIEVALSLRLLSDKYKRQLDITIIEAAQSVLPGYDLKTKKIVLNELKQQRIEVLLGRRVVRVTGDLFVFNDNSVLDHSYLIWTPKPVSYPVLEGSGLATDEKGRLLVNSTLRTSKSELIFGCGDSVAIQDLYRPMPDHDADKEAEILLKNIINTLQGNNLRLYMPLEKSKKVINLGNKRAVTQKQELVSKSGLGWRFRIAHDKKFIRALQGPV